MTLEGVCTTAIAPRGKDGAIEPPSEPTLKRFGNTSPEQEMIALAA